MPPGALRVASARCDGRLRGMLETNTNSTQHGPAEEALRRTEEVQQLSHTGSFGWNPASGEIFWSHESYHIFGYEPTVKPTLDMMLERAHPDDALRVGEAVERARGDRKSFDLEYRLLLPNQSIRHLQVVARPVIDQQRQVVFMGAASRNPYAGYLQTSPPAQWYSAAPCGSR